ncbi:hypothetical protein [Vibrio sp. D431a]|uniref:hypothetical protein n=1 Tax=Vibrio sp. D431a TaxID=2837388 RepID=UPI0025567FBA|nr:hypothetical protein [Vibrio sp. D431a]MDK9790187.1 hypothetical protein [Vibrio sp. D431a]
MKFPNILGVEFVLAVVLGVAVLVIRASEHDRSARFVESSSKSDEQTITEVLDEYGLSTQSEDGYDQVSICR